MTDGAGERSARTQLAQVLRELRTQRAHVSQTEAARLAGPTFTQPKVTRLESGKRTASVLDVGRLAYALGARGAELRNALRLAVDVRREEQGLAPVRVALTQRPSETQRRIRHAERDAERVTTYHPSLVPGLLQTEAYMRAVYRTSHPDDQAGADAFVRERRARQEERAARSATQYVTEGALCSPLDGPDVMAAQARHIAELVRTHPHWDIALVPRTIPAGMRTALPLNGFDLLDAHTLTVGTTLGNTQVSRRDVIDAHLDRLAVVDQYAVRGDRARAELERIAQDYERARNR